MEDRGSSSREDLHAGLRPVVGDLSSRNIVLGVTGSIAAYKAAELVRLFKRAGAEVQVLMTPDAARFVTPLTLGTLSEREVLSDIFPENETGSWTKHVHLGIWADLFVVAPATATTIARLAQGICDSMLTAAALSRRCRMLVCPAMDHDMFQHPATRRNLATLQGDGVLIMPPEYGELASGLIGEGRMPEPETVARYVVEILGTTTGSRALSGKKVLITAGPTREAIDPVRFLSNRSTGTMGFALAEVAAQRGADVVLVTGPASLPTPEGVLRIDVTSAADMHEAAMRHVDADLVIGAAAVADYAPAEFSARKVKKGEGDLVLHLRRTPDILAEIGARKRPAQTLVGFALETDDGERNARAKLERKQLDWIVLNRPDEEGSGFGTGTNRVTLLARDGRKIELPEMPKRNVAEHILDRALEAMSTAEKEI
jgi:phosphopantothenoylcysteine decarboxylase / phosphopantothenate---cysteine ligase